jgi:hypothetical protein
LKNGWKYMRTFPTWTLGVMRYFILEIICYSTKNIDYHNYSEGAAFSLGVNSTHSYSVCYLIHWTIPSAFRSPLKSRGRADLSLRKNFTVGKPWISTPETSFSVESILTKRMLGLLASFLAASSKWGAICLQWVHHGA